MVAKKNKLLAAATISGGFTGLLAIALIAWTIWTWYDMKCSFKENVSCKFPTSSKDIADETYYMNIKQVIAWIVLLPSMLTIFLAFLVFLKKNYK